MGESEKISFLLYHLDQEMPDKIKKGPPSSDFLDSDPYAIDETVRSFIRRHTPYAMSEIGPDDPLFSNGLLDSMTFVGLALFLEEEYLFRFSDSVEINMDTFDTIRSITTTVLTASRHRRMKDRTKRKIKRPLGKILLNFLRRVFDYDWSRYTRSTK